MEIIKEEVEAENEDSLFCFRKITIPNFGIYEGRVSKKTLLPDGEGKLDLENGMEYTGNFKNGLMEGKGVLQDFNSNYYEGNFKNGVKHGKAVEVIKGNSQIGEVIYKGGFRNGKRHGYGENLYFLLKLFLNENF